MPLQTSTSSVEWRHCLHLTSNNAPEFASHIFQSDALPPEGVLVGGVNNDFSLFMARLMLQRNALNTANALVRMATGRALNSGADGPAALIASVSFDSTLAAIDAQNEINVRASNQATVADAGLESISDLLVDAKSLVSANATNTLSDAERNANQLELDSILDNVDRLSDSTQFNGQRLLDGSGAISSADDSINIDDASSEHIGEVEINGVKFTLADVASGKVLNILNGNTEGAAMAIDQAIDDISIMRGELGGFSQGVLASQGALIKSKFNLSSGLSMIRDTDYAMEQSRRIRAQVLAAAGNYAIGYAGAYPGGMISLFG